VWDGGNTHFWDLYDGNPVVKNGRISMSDKPGLGYTLKHDVVEKLRLKRDGK
jgi:L-alanine-DL-glutamate epimerase-like enolase superfamily enzyme